MKNLTKFLMLSVMISMFLGIAACGKVSKAVPIEGSGYPHTYPRR